MFIISGQFHQGEEGGKGSDYHSPSEDHQKIIRRFRFTEQSALAPLQQAAKAVSLAIFMAYFQVTPAC